MKVKTNRCKWYEYAEINNIPKDIAHSPIDRILYKFNIAPVFFWNLFSLTAILSILFSIIYGLIMYFWVWMERPILISVLASAVAGLFFGISMSLLLHWRRRKWKLKWEDIVSDQTTL